MLRKLKNKLAALFSSTYNVVYTTKDGRTQMYTISKPMHRREFGNASEGKRVVGFRAHCFNRNGVRSFRYDRIISLVRG